MDIHKTLSIIYYIGMGLILAGIFFQLNDLPYACFFMGSGAIALLAIRLFNFLKGKPENKRLHGIMVVSALFFVGAGALMLMQRNYWIIGVFIAAMLDLYVSLRKFKH
ncbi:hypothetical protein [Saccharicrinis fermentans]|uniref:Acid-resistance membrane protein n=1 Tax=Saccharicrinis fermentans DSM 9555 = JCM 21142 TaxID=869213 RepID=W7Y7F7_9BACT|nr:hypothetical protein [Saccharicrinis fermentans]GAF03578.1 hypothetical protein JCM21142_52256 [Saccharicrinis fermentans DSM 9555 = JCM 21142]